MSENKTKFIAELPRSEYDWVLKTVKYENGTQAIIAVCRDQPVHIITEHGTEELVLR